MTIKPVDSSDLKSDQDSWRKSETVSAEKNILQTLYEVFTRQAYLMHLTVESLIELIKMG